MRKLFWAVAIAIGAVAVKKHLKRRERQHAQDKAAKSNWENEGGAPDPANV